MKVHRSSFRVNAAYFAAGLRELATNPAIAERFPLKVLFGAEFPANEVQPAYLPSESSVRLTAASHFAMSSTFAYSAPSARMALANLINSWALAKLSRLRKTTHPVATARQFVSGFSRP
jgi:hypothetical protein